MPRKKNHAFGLGQALIKDRFAKKKSQYAHLHAAEIEQEKQSGGLLTDNLKSVVELDSIDDFIASAELQGTDFTAERLNLRYVDESKAGLIPVEKIARITQLQTDIDKMLSVPRRPKWDITTSKEDLDRMEKDTFLEWRRHLAKIQEENDVKLTPYEKNLDFWRQLWRVVERSDVIVQIVDARDPLLYRCPDLESYVKEVSESMGDKKRKKQNMILVNKADFLSPQQRRLWKNYWDEKGVTAVFWSALLENEKIGEEVDSKLPDDGDTDEPVEKTNDDDETVQNDEDEDTEDDTVKRLEELTIANKTEEKPKVAPEPEEDPDTKCLTRAELIAYFKKFRESGQDSITVGMVGYPNVGKSSTVNTLMGSKRAAVSATPGRTKHFQTLIVDHELTLCDCPGLVFPSYVSNSAEMILCGILNIDQLRDYVPPVNLLAARISRSILNAFYGIRIARPKEHEPNQNRSPTSSELLDAHALSRGFMTSHGQPDNSRSARIVLKDYVTGKLVYSKPPPGGDIEQYQSTTPMLSEVRSIVGERKYRSTQQQIIVENQKLKEEAREEEDDPHISSFVVGSNSRLGGGRNHNVVSQGKKHFKKKKEKQRRIRTVKY